jgi:hypothetical protein
MKTTTLILSLIIITSFTLAQVPPPTLQPGEYWTQLFSASYDFQSNGSIRYIVQHPNEPNKLFAIISAIEDSVINNPLVERYIYTAYSSNNGRTWIKKVVDTSMAYSTPGVDLRNGMPVIAASRVPNTSVGISVFIDLQFGSLFFYHMSGITSNYLGRFPQIGCASNGNIIVAAVPRPGFSGHYTYYNEGNWSAPVQLPNTGGATGQFSIESSLNGKVFIFGLNFEDPPYYGNRLHLSTNNGVTFTLQTGSNAPPEWLPNGSSVLAAYADGGRSGAFVGDEVHLVYTVYDTSSVSLPSPPNTTWFKSCKIIHWSQNTGIDTVAARYNMPTMTDTLTQALVTPLCHPSMGYYNGYIYVIYTAFLRGNKQTVDDGSILNTGEIFITRSSDNGNTWSAPVNLTNTPFIEEKHPSAVRIFNLPAGDSVGVYYLRDLKAGGWVNNSFWGKAPVYGIYKKVGANVLGIQHQLELDREFKLFQNYPNPFNPVTTISYNLQKASFVTLKIHNVLGEEVKILVNEEQKSGAKEISFDAGGLPSGVYFYTLSAGEFRDTKSMVIIK